MKLLTMERRDRPISKEYRELLSDVVRALLDKTRDPRLPQLTPEQVPYWLTNLRIEDVQFAFRYLGFGRAEEQRA